MAVRADTLAGGMRGAVPIRSIKLSRRARRPVAVSTALPRFVNGAARPLPVGLVPTLGVASLTDSTLNVTNGTVGAAARGREAHHAHRRGRGARVSGRIFPRTKEALVGNWRVTCIGVVVLGVCLAATPRAAQAHKEFDLSIG